MRFFAGGVVFLVHFNSLIGFRRNHASARHVERDAEHAGLAVHRARLDRGVEPLEVVAGAPVPEVHRAVVSAGDQNPVGVHRQAVDYRVVARQILNELALWALPLLDIVRRRRGEHVQGRMERERAHALLVIRQRGPGLAGGQVPQANRAVVTAANDLRLGGLAYHARHCIGMPDECVDIRLGTHVPHSPG